MTLIAFAPVVALLLAETTMEFDVDPVFVTGIVAICAIFALAVVTVAIISPNEGVAKEALKTLVTLFRSFGN